ncbi:MAG: hypothetical protein SV765_14515 [Pseudomonadota bacterium]|nr:hypothetical protein [Pseudomonadales bacterium]MDY6921414.1 hypothetical protein [Pseudomonadota bacterium]
MIKKIILIFSLVSLTACATHRLEIKPIASVSTYLSSTSFDSLELVGDEIWLKKSGKLIGTFKSIKKQDKYDSAISEVRAGYETMKDKGGIEIANEGSTYGFYAQTKNFRTYYIAHKKTNDHWALISIKADLVDSSTLRFNE